VSASPKPSSEPARELLASDAAARDQGQSAAGGGAFAANQCDTSRGVMLSTSGHRQSILIVDDETMVRRVIQRMLEERGYQVFEASDGRVALDFVRAAPELLDLVVTDISMPHLNGIALMQALSIEVPELPCVLISGYAPPELERFGLKPPCGVLRKPLVEPEFLAEVQRCLRNRN